MTDVLAPPAIEADAPEPHVQTRGETVLRLTALVVGTALAVAAIVALGGWAWVVVIGAVIAIIMLHELGHFVTARRCGMKATEFFVGFGPRLWSIRRGETEYGIKALPLGGYVKILGMTSAEELDPSDEPRSFVNQSTGKRVLVASAGSIMHLLIALALAIGALWFIGNPQPSLVKIYSLSPAIAGAPTPAQLAGLRAGDQFVSINGVKINGDNIVSTIEASKNKLLTIVVLRDGHDVTVAATPRPRPTGAHTAYLGVSLIGLPQTYTHPGFIGGLTGGTALVWRVVTGTVGAFGNTFSPSGLGSLAHQVQSSRAADQARASGQGTYSIIGAVELLVDAVRSSPIDAIEILIALNISLGLLNMLPMLPLDGGHVAIALYERARTRKGLPRYRSDVNKLMPAVYVFMAFLLVFVAAKMYLDVAHGVPNPFG